VTGFKCETCGDVPLVLVDGYAVGDRLLEGVMFEIRRPGKVFLATPDGEAMAYMRSAGISVSKWSAAVAQDVTESASEGEAFGACPKCGEDVEILNDSGSVDKTPPTFRQIKATPAADIIALLMAGAQGSTFVPGTRGW
jgi:hypothetical protein